MIANESYREFSDSLQKEISEETGIKFGVVSIENLSGIVIVYTEEEKQFLGKEKAKKLIEELTDLKYIDKTGHIQKSFEDCVENKTITGLSEEFADVEDKIISSIVEATETYTIKNAKKREKVTINTKNLNSEYFTLLWNKIKHKTVYNVQFDTDDLIEKASRLVSTIKIKNVGMEVIRNDVTITEAGVGGVNEKKRREDNPAGYIVPNILQEIQNQTNLTRSTIYKIIEKSKTIGLLKKNPESYIKEVTKKINNSLYEAMVDGIRYIKTNEFYEATILDIEDKEYIDETLIPATKSIYNQNIFDSKIERELAKEFEKQDDVKLYTKLPSTFKINTPLGTYNPDWAIVVEKNTQSKLFFVFESKGTNDKEELKQKEKLKIDCGEKHFESLNENISLIMGKDYSDIEKCY